MLCPQCGANVGEKVQLCERCQEQAALAAAAAPQVGADSREDIPGKVSPRGGRPPDVDFDHMPANESFFEHLANPAVMAVLMVFFLLLSFVLLKVLAPAKSLVECGFMTLILAGAALGTAAPYAFAFDESATRRITMRVLGAAVVAIGLFSYSAYTKKGMGELYDEVMGRDAAGSGRVHSNR